MKISLFINLHKICDDSKFTTFEEHKMILTTEIICKENKMSIIFFYLNFVDIFLTKCCHSSQEIATIKDQKHICIKKIW